jgi:ABC-type nitrate/sulfonate/bicarbonate transport system substrate-binding protein
MRVTNGKPTAATVSAMTDAAQNRQGLLSRRAVLGGGLRLAGGAALLGGLGSVGESLLGAARAGASTMPMMSTIKFQLGWLTNTEFAGSYLAASKGYYAKAGLDVTILPGEGVDVEGIVGAGKALVGDSNADTCSAAVAQGADLKIIGAKYQKNPFCIISSAKKPITTPKELIGKKVGINAYNFTGWSTFLAVNGISPSQVHTVNEGYTSGPQPLADGRVDAWMGFITNEPTVLELGGFPVHTFLLAEFGYEVYADIYETTSSAITEHKDELVEFLRAERQGWEADIANPAAGLALTMSTYGKKLGLDDKQQGLENKAQLALMKTAYTKSNGLFAMDPADIAKNLATLEFAKSKKIGNYYTKADLFDDSILKAL